MTQRSRLAGSIWTGVRASLGPSEHSPGRPQVSARLHRLVIGLAIGLIAATCVFAIGRATWRVINTDGGWYSYPGYALSQGRDPEENLLPPNLLPLGTPGVRSLFHWDNGSLLLTRIDSAWFVLAGHGQESLLLYGALQWLGLAALIAWAVTRLTGSRWAAGAAALAVLSDVQIVNQSFADLRPDMPIALIAAASLCFFINFRGRRSPASLVASGVLIGILPLVQTTGVLPAAMLLTCLGVSALMPVGGRISRRYLLACAIVAAGVVAVFFLRKPILAVLIPTKVPLVYLLKGRHDMSALLLGIADRGILWKLAQERQRWSGYFLPDNLPQLIFLLAGLVLMLRAAWRTPAERRERLWLPAGWIVGILTLTATDPHFTPTHLIPLIALGYVMAGAGWAPVLEGSGPERGAVRSRAVAALAALAFLGFGLRTAQAAYDAYQGIHTGVSVAAVRRLMAKTFPGTGVTWAVGPTSIWLYVPRGGRPVIMDKRSDPGVVKTALWKQVSVLVIDSDFLRYGWGKIARQGVAAGWLRPIGQVGSLGDKYCLEAFRVEHPGGG